MKTKFLQRVLWLMIPLLMLFSIDAWTATYELYSGTITEGDYIIFYSNGAMKAEISSKRFTYESVTPSNNKITNPANENLIVWHIAASGTYWTIYNAQNGGKYAAGNNSNNQGALIASITDYAKWTVTGSSTYEFVNKGNKANSKNANLRKNTTYGFACYGTGTGGALSLYKKTVSCTVAPTVGSDLTSVSTTTTSITATVPISAIGGCNITENGLVYSTSNTTPTVGGTNCTKVTVTACGSTAANKEVTISGLTCGTTYYVRGYATNDAGTSYTNVKTQATSDCPLYTITYNAGSGTCATSSWPQPSYGASTTLPEATPTATCDGWSFAGWCTSSAGDEEDNTTSPGTILTGSYTPTSDMTLYAVYTKEGTGGGSTPASITLTQSDFGASYPSGQNTGTITKGDYSFTYGQYRKNQNGAPNDWCQNQLIQARCTLNIGLWNTTAMDITSVVLYKASPTANASTWAVYEGTSSAKPTSGAITVSTGSASSITADKYYSGSCHSEELTGVTETPLTYTTSSGCKYINIAPTNGTSYFTKIIINYTTSGGSTTYYMTSYTCCANVVAAPTVSATNIHYNQFTLSWTNVTGADSYNVTCTGGTPGAIQSDGTTRTCTITGLASPNTSYSWTVVATYSGSYCGATPAAGSTTTAQVYTVTYNANGGTVSPLPSTVSYEAGVTVTVAAEPGSTSKSGCTFTGWNTQADGQGTHYAASGSATFTMPSSTVTLYAEWTKKKNYYVDRMHGTNDGHTVTIDDVVYNCYLREGYQYTVPTISDNTSGATTCHNEHDHLLFWVTASSVNDDGTLKGGYTEVTPGSSKTATTDGTIYYAIWGKLAD